MGHCGTQCADYAVHKHFLSDFLELGILMNLANGQGPSFPNHRYLAGTERILLGGFNLVFNLKNRHLGSSSSG